MKTFSQAWASAQRDKNYMSMTTRPTKRATKQYGYEVSSAIPAHYRPTKARRTPSRQTLLANSARNEWHYSTTMAMGRALEDLEAWARKARYSG